MMELTFSVSNFKPQFKLQAHFINRRFFTEAEILSEVNNIRTNCAQYSIHLRAHLAAFSTEKNKSKRKWHILFKEV